MIPIRDITECDHCGVCCQRAPCTLDSLEEIRAIEKKLGSSIRDGLWILLREDLTWQVIISSPPCRFHIDNRCAIHDVKPLGGRTFECWSKNSNAPSLIWSDDEMRELGFDVRSRERLTKLNT
jgi:Fe-S-cluster containining protein